MHLDRPIFFSSFQFFLSGSSQAARGTASLVVISRQTRAPALLLTGVRCDHPVLRRRRLLMLRLLLLLRLLLVLLVVCQMI